MSLSLATRRDRLLAVRARIDAGDGGAVQLYDDAMADSPEAAATVSPVAIIALAAVSFDLHATDAQMDLVPAVGFAARAGLPTWARFVDGAGAGVYICTAGPPGSGAVLIVTDDADPPTAQLYTGGQVTVTASVTEPA
jgi:hypothetical protein